MGWLIRRAWWRVDKKRVRDGAIHHVVAVPEGVARGVFRIGDDWLVAPNGRRAFDVSPEADPDVVACWMGESGRRVPFTEGSQNPVAYWPRAA